MPTVIAIACFTLATIALTIGVVTEYRQTRAHGPVATVPTLPWAVAGAMMVVLGLFWLPQSIPWWIYPVAFFGAVFTFGYTICRAAARR